MVSDGSGMLPDHFQRLLVHFWYVIFEKCMFCMASNPSDGLMDDYQSDGFTSNSQHYDFRGSSQ